MVDRASLFVNAHSRRGRQWFEPSVAALEASGLQLDHAEAYRHPGDLIAAVAAATERGDPVVIVGGGDGTVSSVVRSFVDRPSALGLLPLGTGNQFARDLGIPADVQAACRIIREGTPHPVDLGVVDDDYFVNVATIGLTTQIAEALTGNQKRTLGRFAYAFALVRGLVRMRKFHATLRTPEGTHEFDTLQIVIGNGRFHAGPFPLHPDAAITDGRLNIYAVKGTHPWGFVKLALHLPGGRHVHLDEVPAITTSSCRITTVPSKRVTVDGEISTRTPVRFGIHPGAIRVIVPDDFVRSAR